MQNERSQTGFERVRVHFLCRVICMSSPEPHSLRNVALRCVSSLLWDFQGRSAHFLQVFLPAVLLWWSSWQLQAPSHVTVLSKSRLFPQRVWGVNFYSVEILCKPLFPAYLQKSVAGYTLQCSGVNNMNLFHMRSSSLVIKQDDVW